eukprot:scaffold1768_cov194-Prasinococcus_capsulatus_cf.AAC.8
MLVASDRPGRCAGGRRRAMGGMVAPVARCGCSCRAGAHARAHVWRCAAGYIKRTAALRRRCTAAQSEVGRAPWLSARAASCASQLRPERPCAGGSLAAYPVLAARPRVARAYGPACTRARSAADGARLAWPRAARTPEHGDIDLLRLEKRPQPPQPGASEAARVARRSRGAPVENRARGKGDAGRRRGRQPAQAAYHVAGATAAAD